MTNYLKRPWRANNLELIVHSLIWLTFVLEKWINHVPYASNPLIYGIYKTTFIIAGLIIPLYLNALVLIPKLLSRKRVVTYLICLANVIAVSCLLRGLLTMIYFHSVEFNQLPFDTVKTWAFRDFLSLDKFAFSQTGLALMLSFGYRFVKDWLLHERVQERLRSEKATMELSFLKAQINPHFIFNSLNSIYALALEDKAEKTADAIGKMGSLMRYSLHENQADKILLSREADYLEKYIALQCLRISDTQSTHIQSHFNLEAVTTEKIAPMILLPFIENAFKYGVSLVTRSEISIKLHYESGKIYLETRNTICDVMKSEGGIGLSNVKNRLQLIYPLRHKLKISKGGDQYLVQLEIDIKND